MSKDLSILPKKTTSSVSKKIINIIKMLKEFDTGKSYTVKELARKFDLSEKTIYRYLSTLKEAHVPILRDPVTLRYSFIDNYSIGISDIDDDEEVQLVGDISSDAVMMLNKDGRITYWNRSAEGLYGYKSEEVLGKNAITLLSPKRFHKKNFEYFKKMGIKGIRPNVGINNEYIAVRKNGDEILVTTSFLSIMVRGELKIIIIEKEAMKKKKGKETEKKLQKKNERMFKDYARDGVFVIDFNNRVAYWNSSAENIFGYKKNEVLGKDIFGFLLDKKSNKGLIDELHEFKNDENKKSITKRVQFEAKRKDGLMINPSAFLLINKKWKDELLVIIRVPIPELF